MIQLKTRLLGSRLSTLLIASSSVLLAQTSAVGTITGKVTRSDGSPVASQTVILETPRGNREFQTDARGQFLIPNLLPGKVVLKVNAKDMTDFRSELLVMANKTSSVSIRLVPAAGKTVEVIDLSVPLNTTDPSESKMGFATTMDQVNDLPILLTTGSDRLGGVLQLVPGTWTGRAYHGGTTLAYHVDGVDTTDSNWGGAGTSLNNDLLDQIQMFTGSVSAKYGRFDGGLVILTTKSGTNEFEGSARMAISNPKWGGLGKTPEIYKALGIALPRALDATTTIQSYTFMGPIIKDKLFFSLGFQTFSPQKKTMGSTSGLTFGSVPYVMTENNTLKDLKLDWNIDPSNRLSFQYNSHKAESTNSYTNVANPSSLATLSGLKRTETGYYSLGWTSQLASSLLLDVKYNDAFYKAGGPGTGSTGGASVITWQDVPDHVLFDNGAFSDVKEERHQKVFSAGVSWYATAMGEHRVDAGYEGYQFTLESGALDFPSGYMISFNGFAPGSTTPAVANRLLAVQNPALTSLTWQQAVNGKATTKNYSLYLNDTWALDKHISFNLGLRYDKFSSDTVPEGNHYSTQAYAPRLAFNYDLNGDKVDTFSLTAAEYASQILQGNLASASVTKTPITRTYLYNGTGGSAQGTGTDAVTSTGAINWAAWGDYSGVNGQDHAVSISDPIQNRTTFVDPNLKAPRTREVTLAYRHETLQQAFTATLIRRWMDRFVDDIWFGNGISQGVAKRLISNDPDGKQDYYGLELTYRNNQVQNFSFGGNATWSRALSNIWAQANNFGPGISRDQLAPYGPSYAIDRPFVLHADATWRRTVGKGTINVSLMGSYFAKMPYQFRRGTALTPVNLVMEGFAATYDRQFPELGPLHQPAYSTLDMQIGYEHGFGRKGKAFAKLNIANLLNYMPNYMNTYYGTAFTGTYQPFALFDGKGTVNVSARQASLDLGIRF